MTEKSPKNDRGNHKVTFYCSKMVEYCGKMT
jgi:hypothetical protein